MLLIPALLLISYFFVLLPPPSVPRWTLPSPVGESLTTDRRPLMEESSLQETGRSSPLTLSQKWQIIRSLLKYMAPLSLVYFAEYFINQGLFELMYFPNISMSHSEQYRW
ncbi:hypothetical protein FKM82_025157 [Ascaphus truei]